MPSKNKPYVFTCAGCSRKLRSRYQILNFALVVPHAISRICTRCLRQLRAAPFATVHGDIVRFPTQAMLTLRTRQLNDHIDEELSLANDKRSTFKLRQDQDAAHYMAGYISALTTLRRLVHNTLGLLPEDKP